MSRAENYANRSIDGMRHCREHDTREGGIRTWPIDYWPPSKTREWRQSRLCQQETHSCSFSRYKQSPPLSLAPGFTIQTRKYRSIRSHSRVVKKFLTDRSICVRIGGFTSDPRSVNKGVPQGAVISPMLFNLMLIDFPNPPPDITHMLYADDIALYTQVSLPINAEPVLQPYIDTILNWGRDWQFSFSVLLFAFIISYY